MLLLSSSTSERGSGRYILKPLIIRTGFYKAWQSEPAPARILIISRGSAPRWIRIMSPLSEIALILTLNDTFL